jgi:hypothetical protein
MSTTVSDQCQKAIRRTLAHHAGDTPEAITVAEATLSIWHQMAARLEPVIGAQGVDVLFRRSLHLTISDFPTLAISGDQGGSAALLASLKANLESLNTDVTSEASYTLLATFTELLITLIGESLTVRLLDSIWVPPPPTSGQETVS